MRLRLLLPLLPLLLPPPSGFAEQRPALSDQEVGEIRTAAAAYVPGDIIQFVQAHKGCDGFFDPAATDEMNVSIHTGEGLKTLCVSKIGGHWEVGGRQRRVLQRQVLLRTEREELSSTGNDREATMRLLRQFQQLFAELNEEDRLDGVGSRSVVASRNAQGPCLAD